MKFSPLDPERSDLEAAPGEVAMAVNLVPRNDGALGRYTLDNHAGASVSASARTLSVAGSYVTMEFGLRKAGHLSWPLTVDTGSGLLSTDTASGSGASRPHHADVTDTSGQLGDLRAVVADAYRQAVSSQVESPGYFHRPFLLRYALRLTDGTAILPSPPMLMLPSVLPPLIGLSVTESDGAAVAAFDFTDNKYFELTYRITGIPETELSALIESIDVYVSPQIPTHSSTAFDDACDGTFASVLSSAVSGLRGRSGDTDTAAGVFDGHYSESADCYVDHYADDTMRGRRAWVLAANPALPDDIASVSSFYKIASLPYGRALADGPAEHFATLPLLCGTGEALLRMPTLADNSTTHREILAAVTHTIDGHMVAGASGETPCRALPLVSAVAFAGDALSAAASEIESCVYIRHGGEVYAYTSRSEGMPESLTLSFPRYVCHPDRRAFFMTLSQDGMVYALPLTPHASLDCACWTGDITGENAAPDASGIPEAAHTDEPLPCDDILVSAPGNHLFFPPENTLSTGCGKVVAFADVLSAPGSGSFGKYHLYVFATAGIWMLEYSVAKSKFVSWQRFSTEVATGARAVVACDGRVAAATRSGVIMVKGSEVLAVGRGLAAMTFDSMRLHHIAEVLRGAGMTTDACELDSFLGDCSLAWDEERRLLVVSSPGFPYAFAYGVDSCMWSVITGGDVAGQLLLTRPWKHTGERDTLTVTGDFAHGEVSVALYGSDDIRRWHLVGSSATHHICVADRTPWRYSRAVVVAGMSPEGFLHGLRAGE